MISCGGDWRVLFVFFDFWVRDFFFLEILFVIIMFFVCLCVFVCEGVYVCCVYSYVFMCVVCVCECVYRWGIYMSCASVYICV